MAGYKPVAIQTYPVLGEKITQDTLYWNNYKVKYERKWGTRAFEQFLPIYVSVSSCQSPYHLIILTMQLLNTEHVYNGKWNYKT